MQLYKKKCEAPMKTGIRQGMVSGGGFGASFFLLFAFYAASFYAGARLVEDGKATFSDVFKVSISFVSYIYLSSFPKWQIFINTKMSH